MAYKLQSTSIQAYKHKRGTRATTGTVTAIVQGSKVGADCNQNSYQQVQSQDSEGAATVIQECSRNMECPS